LKSGVLKASTVARGCNTRKVISLDLALQLRRAGLPWLPAAGDRFIVPSREMEAEVFVISEMVVEARDVPSGQILAFNGTTEWALDSISARSVVWLPREGQLRDLLADRFLSLEGVPGGYVATIEVDGRQERHIDVDAESAYARAVLSILS
jgi:hypothetical protein